MREREKDGTCWAITMFPEQYGVTFFWVEMWIWMTLKWNTNKFDSKMSLQTEKFHLQIVYPLTKKAHFNKCAQITQLKYQYSIFFLNKKYQHSIVMA